MVLIAPAIWFAICTRSRSIVTDIGCTCVMRYTIWVGVKKLQTTLNSLGYSFCHHTPFKWTISLTLYSVYIINRFCFFEDTVAMVHKQVTVR